MSRLAIASALLVGSTQFVGAVDYTVPPNLTATRTITGSDTLTVQAGGTITAATAVQWQLGTGPGVTVTNSGTITGTTRAFDTSGAAAGSRSLTLVNTGSGVVTAASDALRINSAVTSGAFLIDNAGLITSTTNGRAADLRLVTGGTTTIVNRSGGVIRAVNQDGIGLGGGTISVTNSGVIEAGTGGGLFRAINLSSAATLVSMTVTNNAGATISSTNDAVRIGSAAPSGATILVTNAGTILSQSGQAIDFDSTGATGVTITINNLAGGVIQSNGQDGVRPGQNGTVNNAGTIFAGGAAGNSYDGVDFQNNTAGTVNNLAGGTISGLRHGINASAGTMVVTNALGASITGRNGSGVGFDGAGTVTNYGTITGAYAGNGTGDGDGVDIDLAATIVNYGTIQGTGAGGVDSGNRFNNSEGISIGGGTIENYGTVSGATYAIVVNNDSNVDNSRSGVAATTLTNYAGGTITGQNGYAIRLENKTGTAADNDTIVNYGTIVGSGAIPDPNGIVLRGDGTPDPGSVGTLNGVTYTGTGAARFIRGDGAAIQTGEGNDTLTNYGTITGRNGRAISLEGGNDTLNLATGSSVSGRIDGGVGTDTINLFGTGSGTLANVVNFEVLNVQGGAWALLDDQAYSAGATISRGATLTVGNGATSGTLAANVANEGTIAFNRTDSATFAGVVSGSGGLQQAGSGTTILTGANTYTGGTVISAGTLQIGAGGTSGSITGNVVTSGTLAFNRSDAIIFAGTISGTGGLAQLGSGTTVLTGENSYAGGTTISAGTLQIGAGGTTGSIVGPVANSGTIAFNRVDTATFAGAISGSGALAQIGTGTTVLTGENTYTGGTTIASGTLQIGAGGATGSIVGPVANGGTIAFNRAGTLTLAGPISGTGALVQAGPGTTVLSGANTYTGGTTIAAGTLQLGAGGATGSITGGIANNGVLAINRSDAFTLTNPVSGTGALAQIGSGTTTIATANTYSGGTRVTDGTLQIQGAGNLGSTAGALAVGGGILDLGGTSQSQASLSQTGGLIRNGQLTVGSFTLTGGTLATPLSSTTSFDLQSGTVSAPLGGSGALTKSSSGTVVLTGLNTYTGGTVISGGTLSVASDGNLGAASGPVTLNGGTLATTESFTTARPVTLGAAGGTLSPAAGTTLTESGLVSGSGALTKAGNGILVLTGANTYSGGTTIAGGTIRVETNSALGTGPVTTTGSVLDYAAGLTLQNPIVINSNTTQVSVTAGSATQAGAISELNGPRPLEKIGAGTLVLAAANTYSGPTTISAGTLVGSAASFGSGPIAVNAALVIDQVGDGTLSNALAGAGSFTKTGSGRLALAGASSFSGATTVSAGRLDVNGSLAASAISVSSGATLGGAGIVGALAVAPGGIVAPGSAPAIGTLSVAGSATFASGSTFQVRTDASGAADRLAVGGTATLSGATVQVLAQAGPYRPQTSYLILSAAGGVVGRFGTVFTNLAFLTPALTYGQNGVALTLNRNDVNFASVAGTRNEVAAATGLTSLGVANPLYLALLSRSAPEARTAFNAVSGEAHASLVTTQFETAHMVREAVLGRLRGSFSTGGGLPGFAAGATLPADYAADLPGRRRAPTAMPVGTIDPQVFALWGQGFGSFGSTSGNGNAGTLTRNTGGFVIGGDATIDGTYRFGLAGGFTETAVDIRSRLSTAEIASGFGSVYGGASFGGFNLRIGGIFAGNAVDSRRAVAFPGFSEALRARYGGTSLQGFGEVGYAVQVGPATLEPFLGGAGLVISRDGFTERGGPAALAATGRSYTIETLTAGIRGEMAFAPGSPYSLRGLVAYRGAFGDVSPTALLAFASGSQAFGVSGVPIDRAAFVAEAGIDWKIAPGIAVGIAYAGQVGERAQDHGLRGNLLWRF